MTTYKVAILGQDTYENVSKVKKHLYNWKENFGDSLEIVSGGGKYGVEKNVRDILCYDDWSTKPISNPENMICYNNSKSKLFSIVFKT